MVLDPFAVDNPHHAAAGFLAEERVDGLTGGFPTRFACLELDVPQNAPALEHDVVTRGVDLRPEDIYELFTGEPCLLQDLRHEDMLDERLTGRGVEVGSLAKPKPSLVVVGHGRERRTRDAALEPPIGFVYSQAEGVPGRRASPM